MEPLGTWLDQALPTHSAKSDMAAAIRYCAQRQSKRSMSERELRRIEVLSDVGAGRRTVAAGAAVSAVSERQAYRLLARYEMDGGSGLIHKARGRTSNRSRNEGIGKIAQSGQHFLVDTSGWAL